MYDIIFTTCYGRKVTKMVWGFEAAASYWEAWADLPTYTAGKLVDTETKETIWEF